MYIHTCTHTTHTVWCIIILYTVKHIMSFFNYVDSTDYDLTKEDMLRCCYDEVVAEYTDTGDIAMCGEKFLQDAARFKLEDFKNWMRPLFHSDDFEDSEGN